jgi:hypothetical protein
MSNVSENHSLIFSGKNVNFDVLALGDLSGSITDQFSFEDIFYQKGFSDEDSDAKTLLKVNLENFQDLFKLNLNVLYFRDTKCVDVNKIRYKTYSSGWNNNIDLSYSESIVFENGIFTKHRDQTLKKDFLRSIIKDITGTTKLNHLFRNQIDILNNISSLDLSFNYDIYSMLNKIEELGLLTNKDYDLLDRIDPYYIDTSCGCTIPNSNEETDVSGTLFKHTFSAFNPLRILSTSILGERDMDEGELNTSYDNDVRKTILISDLQNQLCSYFSQIKNYEFSGIDVSNNSYRVWVHEDGVTASNDVSMEDLTETDCSIFDPFFSGLVVYTKQEASNSDYDLDTMVFKKEFDFKFLMGDKLHILLEYHPNNNDSTLMQIEGLNKANKRKYEVILEME